MKAYLPIGALLAVLLVLSAATGPRPLAAQAGGSIAGRVVDEAGAPVSGATVRIADEAGDAARTAVTDREGGFRFTGLAAGTHTLRVTALGYGELETTEVRLPAGERIELELAVPVDPVALRPLSVRTASRTAGSLDDLPAAVTVVEGAELAAGTALSGDLGEILAREVPSLAPSTETLSNYGQPLRGRDFLVLVDGIPQSTPLRNVYRDLRTLDPATVERIEVVRGATAAYGYGAAGGVVNLATRRGPEDGTRFETEVGARISPADAEESFSPRIRQTVGGRMGAADFLLSAGYEQRGAFIDGEGDRIPPDPHAQGGLADATAHTLRGSVGLDAGDGSRLRLSFNHYADFQDLRFAAEAAEAPGAKAGVRSADVPGEEPGTRNTLVSLDYARPDVAGSRLEVQAYWQDYMTRFPFAGYFPEGGSQSYLDASKLGGRATVKTPLPLAAGGELAWGVDLLRDETAQPLVDGRIWVPAIDQRAAAPFAQLRVDVADRVVLRGGIRHERIGLRVGDFEPLFGEEAVEGGELDYAATVGNVGAVAELGRGVQLFGGFSQGFSVADVGRALRSMSGGSVESLRPDAQTVDSWEAGLRGGGARLRASLTGFYNTSELGTTMGDAPEFRMVRSPERIYGVEAAVDVRPLPRLDLGATYAWSEGKRDADEDGTYDTWLPGSRISPPKLTASLTHRTRPGWTNRVQLLRLGDRDRFPGSDAFGEGAVEGYTVVDAQTSLDVWRGTLTLGVRNLFDTLYFPPISQWYNLDFARAAGRGRTASLSYSIAW